MTNYNESLIEKLEELQQVCVHGVDMFSVSQVYAIIRQHQPALSISPEATAKTRLAIGERLAYHTNQDSAEEWLKEADEILEIVRSMSHISNVDPVSISSDNVDETTKNVHKSGTNTTTPYDLNGNNEGGGSGGTCRANEKQREISVIDPRPAIRKIVENCLGADELTERIAETIRPYLRTTEPLPESWETLATNIREIISSEAKKGGSVFDAVDAVVAKLTEGKSTEPVSVSLRKCSEALIPLSDMPKGAQITKEGMMENLERIAKAILDAAGVKYVN